MEVLKMNYTQNEKIMSITTRTLVIGIDIAKDTHVARSIDYRGVELGKALAFDNNAKGFKKFLNWANKIMINNYKENCIVGMEPTGHYWFNIADYINELSNKYKLVLVNPSHVKKSKELDDNCPTKHDKKDALTISKLVKDGRYVFPNIPEGTYAELRTIVKSREEIMRSMVRIRCKIHRWVDIYFPEYREAFKDLTCKTSLVTLKNMPFPQDIVKLENKDIVDIWRTKIKSGIGLKKACQLRQLALDSVGRKFGINSARIEILWLIEDYEKLEERSCSLESQISELLNQIPYADALTNIKGLGEVTVASILSETCDLTNYTHGKQLCKLAGLNLKENSSGKHKGQTTITKRGRSMLRAYLFRAIMPLVSKNPEFKILHNYYTKRPNNPLKKKQSLIAMCCKLLRIMYGIAINNSNYNAKEILKGLNLACITEAA
jgi:transposase